MTTMTVSSYRPSLMFQVHVHENCCQDSEITWTYVTFATQMCQHKVLYQSSRGRGSGPTAMMPTVGTVAIC